MWTAIFKYECIIKFSRPRFIPILVPSFCSFSTIAHPTLQVTSLKHLTLGNTILKWTDKINKAYWKTIFSLAPSYRLVNTLSRSYFPAANKIHVISTWDQQKYFWTNLHFYIKAFCQTEDEYEPIHNLRLIRRLLQLTYYKKYIMTGYHTWVEDLDQFKETFILIFFHC